MTMSEGNGVADRWLPMAYIEPYCCASLGVLRQMVARIGGELDELVAKYLAEKEGWKNGYEMVEDLQDWLSREHEWPAYERWTWRLEDGGKRLRRISKKMRNYGEALKALADAEANELEVARVKSAIRNLQSEI